MTAEETWLERYDDERIREHEERIRLREVKRAAREAGHRCVAAGIQAMAEIRSLPAIQQVMQLEL